MHILDRIIADKRKVLISKKAVTPIEQLIEYSITASPCMPSFSAALAIRPFALIAETKRSSPSQGAIIGSGYDPVAISKRYEEMGAAAISVLTEEGHFGGSVDHLRAVSAAVDLPCLCKDFIFDEYQVYEARAAGAAAILLICRLFTTDELSLLHDLALSIGLDVLVETHNSTEVEQALSIGAEIIGVNSRDLDTLDINMRLLEQLVDKIPKEKIIVAESGLSSVGDLKYVRSIGAQAALVGTALLKGNTDAQEMLEFFQTNT